MRNQSEFIELNEKDMQSCSGGWWWAWAPAVAIVGTIGALNTVYNAGKDLGRDFLYEMLYEQRGEK